MFQSQFATRPELRHPVSQSHIINHMHQRDVCCAQGQHVRHLARRASSPHGRITMVTGYIPADALLADQTVLRAAKMASNLDILFHQWAEYRLARFSKQAQLVSKVSLIQAKARCVVYRDILAEHLVLYHAFLQTAAKECVLFLSFLKGTVPHLVAWIMLAAASLLFVWHQQLHNCWVA